MDTFTAGTVLGSGTAALNQTDEDPCLHSSEGRRMLIKKLKYAVVSGKENKVRDGGGAYSVR